MYDWGNIQTGVFDGTNLHSNPRPEGFRPDPTISSDEVNARNRANNEANAVTNQQNFYRDQANAETARISADYEAAAVTLRKTQAREFAGRSTGLITAGGYLGGVQSHEGALQGLRQDQEVEVRSLFSKRDAAVQAARSAYLEKDFALAKEKTKLAADLESNISTAKDRQASQALAATKAGRETEKFERDQAEEQIKIFAAVPTAPIPKNIERSAKALNISNQQFLELITAARTATTATTQKNKIAAMKDTISILKDFPAGTRVPMPDGSVLTAMGSSADLSVVHETDDVGNVTQITTNKLTGKTKTSSLGKFGKGSDTLKLFETRNDVSGNPATFVKTDTSEFTLVSRYLQTIPGFKNENLTEIITRPNVFLKALDEARKTIKK